MPSRTLTDKRITAFSVASVRIVRKGVKGLVRTAAERGHGPLMTWKAPPSALREGRHRLAFTLQEGSRVQAAALVALQAKLFNDLKEIQ